MPPKRPNTCAQAQQNKHQKLNAPGIPKAPLTTESPPPCGALATSEVEALQTRRNPIVCMRSLRVGMSPRNCTTEGLGAQLVDAPPGTERARCNLDRRDRRVLDQYQMPSKQGVVGHWSSNSRLSDELIIDSKRLTKFPISADWVSDDDQQLQL